jgi:hypothetical protein
MTKARRKDTSYKHNLLVQYHSRKLTPAQIEAVEAKLPGWVWEKINTLPKVREKHSEQRRTITEWLVEAEHLFLTLGRIPTTKVLKKMRMSGLSSAMVNEPERFKHLRTLSDKVPLEDRVAFAEKIAAGNRGVLPLTKLLLEQGHKELVNAIYSNIEAFAHIPRQDHAAHTITEWVNQAKYLWKEFRGEWPVTKYLVSNGYSGLVSCMNKNPQEFSFIKRKRRPSGKVSLSQHVRHAEALTQEHDGYVPATSRLRAMGLNGLERSMRQNPDAYAHLSQQRLHRRAA